MKKENIIEALNYFQDAYVKRDPLVIDAFMETLFVKDDLIIFGTGLSEVCLKDEESKELFTSDWKWWGDYRLDFNTLNITTFESFSYVDVFGSLTYTFNDNDETYQKFIGYVKESMETGTTYDFMDVLHFLSHLLHARDEKQRKCSFPIMTSFIFDEIEGQAKIKRIMFQMMNHSMYKDIRFEDIIPYTRGFSKDVDKIKQLGHQDDLVISDFIFGKKSYMIDQKGCKTEKNQGDLITSCFTNDLEFKIYEDSVTYYKTSTHAFFTVYATLKKEMTQDFLEKKLKEHILSILDSDIPHKDKLFKTRRDIALTYKEIALGSQFTWPIRLHGIIEKQDQEWVIKCLYSGDFFNVILEDK